MHHQYFIISQLLKSAILHGFAFLKPIIPSEKIWKLHTLFYKSSPKTMYRFHPSLCRLMHNIYQNHLCASLAFSWCTLHMTRMCHNDLQPRPGQEKLTRSQPNLEMSSKDCDTNFQVRGSWKNTFRWLHTSLHLRQ